MKPCCPPLVPRFLLGLWLLTGGLLRAAPLDPATEAGSPRHEGLTPGDWAGVRKAHRDWQHRFLDGGDGTYSAANPGQEWRSLFDGTGFLTQPHGKSWEWGLELKAYGVGASLREAEGKPVISVEGTRLAYHWNDDLEEWFRNDARGLEQGWTLQRRPSGPGDEMLRLTLAVRGGLRPVIDQDGRGVRFAEDDGSTALTYGGLKAWDAQGRNLTVRFASAGELLAIEVDEREAVYPIVIDPVARQAFLTASNPGEDDEFGFSVAISGDTIVVGAPGEDSNTNTVNSIPNEGAPEAGAAYVFVRTDGVWSQQAYLKAANSGTIDGFGRSVSIDGDSIVVGAPYEASDSTGVNNPPNNNLPDSGAAYVYTRTGGVWTAQAYLKPSSAGADHFGISVGISGDTIVVGAEYENSSTTGIDTSPDELAIEAGAAYVFFRSGVTWTQQAYLKAGNTGADDRFGAAVAISGDTVVIGAPIEDSGSVGVNGIPDESAPDSGAVYVFTRSGVTWSQEAYLKASNTGSGDVFGYSVAISENNLVVGSINEDSSTTGVNSAPNEAATDAGAAYIFTRSGSTWSQQAYLKAGNAGADDTFGSSVAVSGDRIAVGAESEDSSSTGVNSVPNEGSSGSGAVYVFSRVGNTWGQRSYLKADNTSTFNEFGSSVAIDDGTVVVGSPYESTGGDSAGASDVFTITPTAPLLNLTGKATIRTSKSKFTIKGTASDEDGDLVRVEARDTRPKGTKKYRTAQGTANWRYKAPLKSGRNKIQIRSVDASGRLSGNRKVTIIRE
jgi:trimeric autotransporter adhesin